MGVVLYGYRYSVYAWVARLALMEKGVAYSYEEVNPFAAVVPAAYRALHPFIRVPVLVHDGFELYETGAITRYIDEAFPGRTLQPEEPRARARMAQVISIIDAYRYRPMVRQVFSHRVFGPRMGRPTDEAQIKEGLDAALVVLNALDRLLPWAGLTLADLHLAPMIGYFVMAPEGAAALRRFPRLSVWWDAMRRRSSVIETTPDLPDA